MKIELNRQDLEALVKGCQLSFNQMDHPLAKKAGHWYSDQYGKEGFTKLGDLTDSELLELYNLSKLP